MTHINAGRDLSAILVNSRRKVILLSEGDRVPADARLIEVLHLEADESLLTGESVPVRKGNGAGSTDEARPSGDGSPLVWSGSLIIRGSGLAKVTATGARTEIGRIGTLLGSVESAPTPLQAQTRHLVRLFAAARSSSPSSWCSVPGSSPRVTCWLDGPRRSRRLERRRSSALTRPAPSP